MCLLTGGIVDCGARALLLNEAPVGVDVDGANAREWYDR